MHLASKSVTPAGRNRSTHISDAVVVAHMVCACFTIIVITLSLLLSGCAHGKDKTLSGGVHYALLKGQSIAELNVRANNPTNSQAGRALAVFTLFRHHIRPGASAPEVHRVLTDTRWLQRTDLYGVYALRGKIPVQMTFEDTVFVIHLFRETDENRSPWHIYFRLAGENLREEDALAFLRGDPTTAGNRKLLEFALCFPHSTKPRNLPGRIEIFTNKGNRVLPEW